MLMNTNGPNGTLKLTQGSMHLCGQVGPTIAVASMVQTVVHPLPQLLKIVAELGSSGTYLPSHNPEQMFIKGTTEGT